MTLFFSMLVMTLVFSLLVTVAVLFFMFRLSRTVHTQIGLIDQLKNQVHVLSRGTMGVGRRLIVIEGRFRNMCERQTNLERREPDMMQYDNANKMVELGASIDDIMEACSLTRAEAELLASLHVMRESEKKTEHLIADSA